MMRFGLILVSLSAFAQTAIVPGGGGQLATAIGATDVTIQVLNASCINNGVAASCSSAFVTGKYYNIDNEIVLVNTVTPGSPDTALGVTRGVTSVPSPHGQVAIKSSVVAPEGLGNGVTSVTAACGLSGGTITTSGTIAGSVAVTAHNGSYAIVTGDCGKSLTSNVAATWTLPQAGSTGFPAGWSAYASNIGGTGNLVINTTTSTFYGNGGGGSSGTLTPGTAVRLISDGTNWQVFYTAGPGVSRTVIDFGADPSGSVDSTSAFGAANSFSTNVIVPPGTYKINNWVPLANTTVTCSGGATLRRSTAVAVFTASAANVHFSGCTIDGNSLSAHLADITGAHFWFDSGAAQNSTSYGLFCDTGCDFPKFTDSTYTGITFSSITSSGTTNGGVVTGNDITQSSGSSSSENKGIQLHATGGSGVMQNWTVSNNVIRYTAAAVNGIGIELWRAGGSGDVTQNNVVSNNTIYSPGGIIFGAISIAGGLNTTVVGNAIDMVQGLIETAIELTTSRRCNVADNVIVITGHQSGIGITASDKSIDSDVHDNWIYGDMAGGQFIRIYGDDQFGEQSVAYRISAHHNHLVFLDGASGEGIATSFCNAADCTGNNVEIDHNTITGVGGTGFATWSGTALTWTGGGDQFRGIWGGGSQHIDLGTGATCYPTCTIATVNSPTSITLTSSAGTNTTPLPFIVAVQDGSYCMSEDTFEPNTVSNLRITNNECKNINNGINRNPNVQVSYLLNNTFDNVVSGYVGTPSGGEIRVDPVFGSYSTPGRLTFNVSGATNATPIVITTTLPHSGLADGAAVFVGGVVGNTAANGNYFAKVTSYTSTTFALYNDAGLTSPVAGSGTYVPGVTGWVLYGGSSYFQVNGPNNSQDFSGLLACKDNTGDLNNCVLSANSGGVSIGQHGITFGINMTDLAGGFNPTYNPGTVLPGASTARVDVGVTGCVPGAFAQSSFDGITSSTSLRISATAWTNTVTTVITNLDPSVTWAPGPGRLRSICMVIP